MFSMMEKPAQQLDDKLNDIIEDCTECGSCVKQCGYLQRFGTPSALAKQFKAGKLDVQTIYSCSLCRLCDVYCPEKIEPSSIFYLMRVRMVEAARAPLKQHKRILAYEKWGFSNLFTLSVIPENTKTVFFPGCALAGTRPQQTYKLFEILRETIADLGIVLHCCGKPSHDLGRADFFNENFGKLIGNLKLQGVESIITACPSCHQIFKKYADDFNVTTVYEHFPGKNELPGLISPTTATIHDPCATRFESDVHTSVRNITADIGIELKEMKHREKRTYCCGEGGSACFVSPDITGLWAEKRSGEVEGVAGAPVLTYCAGCVQFLSKRFNTMHILDLMLEPERALAGRTKVSSSPVTYLNRLWLKRKFKKIIRY